MLEVVPALEVPRGLVREGLLARDADALARAFVLVLRANPSLSWASYSDSEGGFSGAYRGPDGGIRVSQSSVALRQLREFAVDESGAWTPTLSRADYAYDPREDQFWRAVAAAKAPTWVGPYVFYDEGVPGMTLAAPDPEPGDGLRGVFTVDFNLNTLSRFAAELRFGESGRVFLLAADGTVIAHPTLRLVEKPDEGSAGRLVTVADIADPALQDFAAALAARRAAGADARAGLFALERDGVRHLAGFRTVGIEPGLVWTVGAVAPEAEFLGVLARNRLAALIIAVTALAAGLAVTLVLARRISVPLARLAGEMEEVGRFRLDDRAPMRTVFREVALMDSSLLGTKGSLRSFAHYVPAELVRTLLASGREATLSGETRTLTVYFSDIAGFTTLAETLTPAQLVEHLGIYFDEMTRIVAAEGGTVDKFIGDAIMAFWGAPLEDPDHAARACAAALASQRRLAELRAAAGASPLAALRARVGVATGEVLVGNIGSHERFNYTVMGDVVNLAARLEGLNKLYGTPILASAAAIEAAGGRIVARPIDLVRVKGKRTAVAVFEPLASSAGAGDEPRALAAIFARALSAYRAGEFAAAEAGYAEALRIRPDDGVTAWLLARTRRLRDAPPPPGWDGTHVAEEK